MAKKEEGLRALVGRKTKKADASRSGIDEIVKSSVHPGDENPTFNKVALTGSDGPKLKRGRIAENPAVYHPPAPSKTAKKRTAKKAPNKSETKAIRKSIAASTQPKGDITETEARKLVLACSQLLDSFQEVARQFQENASGRREGPIYEAWRDINHAQVLLYRSMSIVRETYDLDEES